MFFNKEKKNENATNFAKIGALLIHAAKIDQNYSHEEEEIIKKTLCLKKILRVSINYSFLKITTITVWKAFIMKFSSFNEFFIISFINKKTS